MDKLVNVKNLKPLAVAFFNLKQNYSSLSSTPAKEPDLLFVCVKDVNKAVNSSYNDVNNQNVESETGGRSYERKVLPEDLAKRVMMLTCESTAEGGVCDVYIVGTVHVSTKSCEEVKAVISYLKPQVVFLELCSSRVGILTSTAKTAKVPTMEEIIQGWKKTRNLIWIILNWYSAYVDSELEVLPGAEFRTAFQEAQKYGGEVCLGDRPFQITVRRTWAKFPLWHLTRLFSLPRPTKDLKTMVKEMEDFDMINPDDQKTKTIRFPTIHETVVDERDKYMSSTLLRVASSHNSVVAVVGKGHLPGIKKYWKQPIKIMELLEDIPGKKSPILKSLGVAVTGVAVLSGIYYSFKT